MVFPCAGGLDEFRELYPEWVETNEAAQLQRGCGTGAGQQRSPFGDAGSPRSGAGESNEIPLLGLGSLASLRIQDETENCDSCIGLEADDVSRGSKLTFAQRLRYVIATN